MTTTRKSGPETRRAGRLNFAGRCVARLALSVHTKLLAAFLGITCLLVALALFGVTVLQQANARTEAMVRDQERIAYFNDIHGYLQELNAIAIALSVERPFIERQGRSTWFGSLGYRVSSRTRFLQREINLGARRFGQPGMPDEARIRRFSEAAERLRPLAADIQQQRRAGNWTRAAQIGRTEFFQATRALQRDAYTTVQEIEREAQARAQATAQAYFNSRRSIAAAGLAAVGMALLTGFSISTSLLWPIGRMRLALAEISRGGFGVRVSVPNRDELGELAARLNSTAARLGALYGEVEAQKAQLERWNAALEDKVAAQLEEISRTSRLRRFLPAQVAEMITGAPDGADILRSRKAEITVLFADLRGFTAFANTASPDQVIAALNAFHGACGPLIEASGGTLERFLGDGVMVLFGAPVAMQDAAQRAVDLALQMQGQVPSALSAFEGSGAAALGLGIGVATGPATLGQIGFEGRLDYAAIGPAPNLAARLCGKAAGGEILISQSTAWQADCEMEPAGPFSLKGVGESVPAFVLGAGGLRRQRPADEG